MIHPPGDIEAQRRNIVYTGAFYPPTNDQQSSLYRSSPQQSSSYRSSPQQSSPQHAEPAVCLPLEFRTLSIHVESKVNEAGEGKEDARRKRAVKHLASLDWHKISVHEALTRLGVSPKGGLDEAQAQRRLLRYGRNVISPSKSNKFRKVAGWVFGGFGSILLLASIICFIAWKPLGEPKPASSNLALAVVILIVILIQAVFNAWQDFSTSRVMASVKTLLPSDVLVVRDGFRTKVPAKELVPGDLVTINMGDRVPADLKLIEVSGDLQFDRSVLTGESDPVSGRVVMTDDNFLETKNVALQGTHCINGAGFGVVIQTGDKTVFGVIAKLSSTERPRMTTLQRELLRFVVIIAIFALSVVVLIVILWAAWLRTSHRNVNSVDDLLVNLVNIIVAFIPEGLPIAVTLSLATIANILSKKLVLCKSLSIVETLGAVNVLCSDKTGTLTQNIMHVGSLAVFDTAADSEAFRTILPEIEPDTTGNLLQVVAVGAICNAATFDHSFQLGNNNEKVVSGNATDAAILRFSDSITSADITRHRWTSVYRANFNSKTKFMLQLSELSSAVPLTGHLVPPLAPWDNYTPDCFLLTVKGAPEVLLARCTHVLDPTGGPPALISTAIRGRITDIQERWSRNGQRVILLARRIVRDNWLRAATDRLSEEFAEVVEEYNRDLIIVGLVGLVNPLKPDIKHTVSVCRGAGIRFFIITGDYPATALSIAGQAGIITDTENVDDVTALEAYNEKLTRPYNSDGSIQILKSITITGAQLLTLSSAQMERLCQYEEIVFARTSPEQKLRIVHEFKSRGNVVAVTGDGVNDGPSLKAADCGLAMGSGADVAKEAADIILLGDFSAIIVAIQYGRIVFDNLKKTALFLLPAGIFSELMTILLNVIFGFPPILNNIQMIIISVGTDVLPALSLCLEQPEDNVLLRKARNIKTDRLVDWRFFVQGYLFLGVLDCLCASAMAYWYLQENGIPFSSLVLRYGEWPVLEARPDLLPKAQSVYFFTLVLLQWGNMFVTRCRRLSTFKHSPLKNIYVFLAPPASLCIGIFFSYVPWFQKIFQTRGIPAKFFFIPLTFALSLVLIDESRKYIVRNYPRSFIARVAW